RCGARLEQGRIRVDQGAVDAYGRAAAYVTEPKIFTARGAAERPRFENPDACVACGGRFDLLYERTVGERDGEAWIVLEVRARTRRQPDALDRLGVRFRFDRVEQNVVLNPRDYLVEAFTGLEIREHDRLAAADGRGVELHDVEVRPHIRRQIDLVDDEEVAAGDARASLARDFV